MLWQDLPIKKENQRYMKYFFEKNSVESENMEIEYSVIAVTSKHQFQRQRYRSSEQK